MIQLSNEKSLRTLCRGGKRQDPAWFGAATRRKARECLQGSCTRTGPSLGQCRSLDVNSGGSVQALIGLKLPGSVQDRGRFRGIRGLEQGQERAWSVYISKRGLGSVCRGLAQRHI